MTAIESFKKFDNEYGKITEITTDWYKTLGVITKKTINEKRATYNFPVILERKFNEHIFCVHFVFFLQILWRISGSLMDLHVLKDSANQPIRSHCSMRSLP